MSVESHASPSFQRTCFRSGIGPLYLHRCLEDQTDPIIQCSLRVGGGEGGFGIPDDSIKMSVALENGLVERFIDFGDAADPLQRN